MKPKTAFKPIESTCYICGSTFLKEKYNQTRCLVCKDKDLRKCLKHGEILEPDKKCVQCTIEESHKKYTLENKYYWEECVCGYRGADLNPHIRNQHKDIDYYEFIKIHNIKVKSDYLSDKVKGSNNPGYQHGGKFSPVSDKFIYANSNTKKKVIEKISKSNKENGNNDATLAYWLKVCDGDEKLAKQKLSERQTTFNLEKCIEKYGEEEGLKRWKTRQEKWLKSYNNRSPEQMNELNKKKSN